MRLTLLPIIALALASPALAADKPDEGWYIADVIAADEKPAKFLCRHQCFTLVIAQSPNGDWRPMAMYDNGQLNEVLSAFGVANLAQLRDVRFSTEDAHRAPILTKLVDVATRSCRTDDILKC